MNPVITAALIGAAGAVIGAFLQAVIPGSTIARWFSGKPKSHTLLGDWDSSWGPLPSGPLKYHEVITVTKQSGYKLSGVVNRPEQSDKKWEIEGRYDGHFLQMYYFPSPESKNIDFLDYGCYFLQRRADGSFAGYSTGFGSHEENTEEGTSTDYHELRRRKGT